MLKTITQILSVVILVAVAGAITSARSEESTKPTAGASQSAASVTEEEKQQWIENRLTKFEEFIANDLQAREKMATGMDEMVSKKQLDRKSVCNSTDILLMDHVKVVEKVNLMILELEKHLDQLNEAQRSRLLASKAKMPELMSKVRGCEKY